MLPVSAEQGHGPVVAVFFVYRRRFPLIVAETAMQRCTAVESVTTERSSLCLRKS